MAASDSSDFGAAPPAASGGAPSRRAFAEFEQLVEQNPEAQAARLRELEIDEPDLARQVQVLLAADQRAS